MAGSRGGPGPFVVLQKPRPEAIEAVHLDALVSLRAHSGTMKVLILHSETDSSFVNSLAERLVAAEIDVFRSSDSSRAGDNVLDLVTHHMEDIKYVIAVVSKSFSASSWIAHELSTWMLKEALGNEPAILSVLIEECEVPSFLADRLIFDFCDAYEVTMEALVTTITDGCAEEENAASKIGPRHPSVNHQVNRLKEAFAGGKLTLFCGAGVSISAGIPGWKVFLRRLLSDFFVQSRTVLGLPSDATSLATVYQEYFELSPIIVAQYLKNALGRDYQRTVRDALYASGPSSSPLIDSLCELCRPQRERQALNAIVNFNFDDLIEQSLARNKIKHRAIFEEGQRHSASELPIFHVHGYLPRGLDPDPTADVVFSEDAYHSKFIDPFSWSNLTQLNQLNQRTCLFLGLGMTDPNLRRLLDVAMRKNPDKSLEHYIFKRRYAEDHLARHMSGREGFGDAEENAHKLVRMAEILEERDCNNLGLNVIWVDEFEDIPPLILKLVGG